VVQLVTTAFESERYGDEPPDGERLRHIEGALASLVPEGKWLKD
jgi:hypothetical protein